MQRSGIFFFFFLTWERLEFSVGRMEANVPLFRKCINTKFVFQLYFSTQIISDDCLGSFEISVCLLTYSLDTSVQREVYLGPY